MSAQHVTDVLAKLVVHFPVRHASIESEAEWARAVHSAIRHFDADVLRAAADKIIETRTDRRFPLPAEMRKVCNEIIETRKSATPVLGGNAAFERRYADCSRERIELANDMMRTEMGRTAANEGWILALHDFVRANQRLPDPREAARCKASAALTDEAYRDLIAAHSRDASSPATGGSRNRAGSIVKDSGAGLRPALIRMSETMWKRRRELADIALGRADGSP